MLILLDLRIGLCNKGSMSKQIVLRKVRTGTGARSIYTYAEAFDAETGDLVTAATLDYILKVAVERNWVFVTHTEGELKDLRQKEALALAQNRENEAPVDEVALAKEALAVQDAVNLSGVVHSYSHAMSKLWKLADARKVGSDWVNHHPVAQAFADKCASLAGVQGVTPEAMWAIGKLKAIVAGQKDVY